jgi:RNA-directed DNA polymerase
MNDILKTQRSFTRKASAQRAHRFEDLYHLICREDWITQALQHVLSKEGARTAGVDGMSKNHLKTEEAQAWFVEQLQVDLKSGTYHPSPVKRVWIPKPGKKEKRGLGIPTIRDRVVQELLRMLMEPIWESDFLDCSHGFRPGRRTMDCIAPFYARVTTQNKFLWAIEGDIKKCFDRVNHRILLRLVRRRIADHRIVNLVKAFLKAGLMESGLFEETVTGTPQGGILSPLLANIYLHQLDMWWWRKYGSLSPKQKEARRKATQGNAVLVRYADDFVILWNGTHQGAFALREELRQFLWEQLHLELTEEKTHVTHLTDGLDFLGFHIQWRLDGNKPWLRVTPTRANIRRFKAKIKAMTKRGTAFATPEMRLKALNRVIRGWGNYYRHVSFKQDAHELDFWINRRVLIWLKHKHDGKGVHWILEHYKVRETTNGKNRWNFAATNSKDGSYIFLAKLSDIHLTKYRRRKPENPYLNAVSVPSPDEPETPLLEPRIVNVRPEKVAWLETRAEVLKRDEYRCVECGNVFVPFEIHHEIPQKEGGEDKLDNLQTLCEQCHTKTDSYGRYPSG